MCARLVPDHIAAAWPSEQRNNNIACCQNRLPLARLLKRSACQVRTLPSVVHAQQKGVPLEQCLLA